MKKNDIYLGNGCLYVSFEKSKNKTLNLEFNGNVITTSQVVTIVDYNMFSKNNHTRTESEGYKAIGGGTATDICLKTSLKAGEKCVVLCNAQNQIDAYIQFENANGKLKYKSLAEECFYTHEFQGEINGKITTENKFNNFINSLKC